MTEASSNLFGDPAAARERVAKQIEEAQARAERARALTEQLQQIEVEASSKRREATVRVNASGLLLGLQFSETAFDVTLDQIAEIVMDTYQQAQRAAAAQALELTEQQMGDEVAGRMRADFESRLGSIDDNEPDPDQDRRDGMRGMLWNR